VTVTQNGLNTVSLVLFDVTAGQNVNIRLTDSGSPGCPAISILGPNGAGLIRTISLCGSTGWWSGELRSLAPGTYSIEFAPSAGAGSFTAQIINVPADATASVSTTGITSAVAISTPGQHGNFTFSGTAGQKVAVLLDFVNMTTCVTYSLSYAGGLSFLAPTDLCGRQYVKTALIVLPQTATYTITLVPDLGSGTTDGTGSASVTIFTPPADATAALTFGGMETSFTLTTPGQRGNFTFSGTAGQKINLLIDLIQMTLGGGYNYSILNPDKLGPGRPHQYDDVRLRRPTRLAADRYLHRRADPGHRFATHRRNRVGIRGRLQHPAGRDRRAYAQRNGDQLHGDDAGTAREFHVQRLSGAEGELAARSVAVDRVRLVFNRQPRQHGSDHIELVFRRLLRQQRPHRAAAEWYLYPSDRSGTQMAAQRRHRPSIRNPV
jgi:hypothetical protein